MPDHTASLLEPWAGFYTMMGSSAAALTGLMFVVITLISGADRAPRSREGTALYSTPTVVHFGAALLISVVLSVPWHALIYPRLILGCAGLYGFGYVVLLAYRMRQMSGYRADPEDWCWHTLFPLLSYAAIFAGAVTLTDLPNSAPYAFAFAAAFMLFIGIHNSWDVVTYVTIVAPQEPPVANDGDGAQS